MKIHPIREISVTNLIDLYRLTRDRSTMPIQRLEPLDEVEISDEALRMNRMQAAPSGVRDEWVKRVKAELDAGAYESEQKLDAALNRMIDQVRPEGF